MPQDNDRDLRASFLLPPLVLVMDFRPCVGDIFTMLDAVSPIEAADISGIRDVNRHTETQLPVFRGTRRRKHTTPPFFSGFSTGTPEHCLFSSVVRPFFT